MTFTGNQQLANLAQAWVCAVAASGFTEASAMRKTHGGIPRLANEFNRSGYASCRLGRDLN